MAYPVTMGAITQLYVGTSEDITKENSGEYWTAWARKSKTEHKQANNEGLGKKLWEWCEKEIARF